MPVPSQPLPTIGVSNITEDPKILAALQEIQSILNGNVDATNLDEDIVDPPLQHAFSAHTSSGGTLNDGSLVQMTTEDWDPENLHTTGASTRFTAPEAGYYEFHMTVSGAASANNTRIEAALQRRNSGGVVQRTFYGTTGITTDATNDAVRSHVSAVIFLNANDYVEPRVGIKGGQLNNVYANDQNFWQGRFLGASVS